MPSNTDFNLDNPLTLLLHSLFSNRLVMSAELLGCIPPEKILDEIHVAEKTLADGRISSKLTDASTEPKDEENEDINSKEEFVRWMARARKLKFNYAELYTKMKFLETLKEDIDVQALCKRKLRDAGDQLEANKKILRGLKRDNGQLQTETTSTVSLILKEEEDAERVRVELMDAIRGYQESVQEYEKSKQKQPRHLGSIEDIEVQTEQLKEENASLSQQLLDDEKVRDELTQALQDLKSSLRSKQANIKESTKKAQQDFSQAGSWYECLLEVHSYLAGIRVLESNSEGISFGVTHNLPLDNPLQSRVHVQFSPNDDSISKIEIHPCIIGADQLVSNVKLPSDIGNMLVRLQRLSKVSPPSVS